MPVLNTSHILTDLMEYEKGVEPRDFAAQDIEHDDLENVRSKRSGMQQDAIDMRRLGREQELRRNFKTFSILGMATVTMGTWVAMTTNSTFSLINGGLAGTIWVYLGSWLFTVTLVCSLAEMASMAPTSGGEF